MLIDDDHDVLLLNQKYFQRAGYEVSVHENAENAIEALKSLHPDCILLDVMMPGINGFEALKHIRAYSQAPVIFLTGRDSEDDKINGLLSGAEDYIVKPYSLRELSARIQVQLRKHPHTTPAISGVFSFPPISINLVQHKVFYNLSDEIILSNREYELLYLLVSHNREVISFAEIGNKIWGTYLDNDRKSIMVIASRLRKKLAKYKGLENAIETAYGKGYRFTLKEEGSRHAR